MGIDPSICPICGQANQCAMASGGASAQQRQPCWCVAANFPADLMARVPAKYQGKACICKACADSALNKDEPVATPP